MSRNCRTLPLLYDPCRGMYNSIDGSLAIFYKLCTQRMMQRASLQCSCITIQSRQGILPAHTCKDARGSCCVPSPAVYPTRCMIAVTACIFRKQGGQEMCLRREVPEVAGRRADHDGDVAHEPAQALGRSVPILHHDIQVQGPLVGEALHAQAM